MKPLSRRTFVQTAMLGTPVLLGAAGGESAGQSPSSSNASQKETHAMKIYIITDLEGAAMVSRWDQTRDATPEAAAEARQLLTGEVNAAISGILEAAPDAEIVVWDGHGSGGIDVSEFHPQAKLITHGPIAPPYFLDSSFAALFFVGQHAMAGTPDAPLCHTYSSRTVEYYKLNGQPMGEFGMRAVMAGTMGVPTVFISGDDKAVAEAQSLAPNIHGAVVKQGLGIELALHLSSWAARTVISNTAGKAVMDIGNIPPVKLNPPYEQEIRVCKDASIEGYLKKGAKKLDERTVLFRSDNICDLCV